MKKFSDIAALAAFLLGFFVLAFGYGVAAMQFKIFPYRILWQAKQAADALRLLEDDTLMTGIIRFNADLPPAPTVTRLDPAAGQERLLVLGGFYQYMERCPRFGCVAWIIDRDGRVLHSWETDPATLFPGFENFSGEIGPDNIYPVGAALEPDGSLVLTFHARNSFPYQVGVAKIAVDGSVLWAKSDYSHHWIDIDAAGRIYTPSMRIIDTPEYFETSAVKPRCHNNTTYYEGIRVHGPDGTVLRDFWIDESFAASDYPGLLYSIRDGCDPDHVNSVEVVTPAIARRLPGIEEGDLLVSVRERSAVAILDGRSGLVKLLSAGRTAAQHGPRFLPDGTVVVFDNQGSTPELGGARIVRLNLVTGQASTVFPRDEDGSYLPFFSPDGGHISVSPDGRRLIFSSKHQGRSIEIDIETGRPLWAMEKSFGLRPYLALKKVAAKADRALFKAYGTYYLSTAQTAFIGR